VAEEELDLIAEQMGIGQAAVKAARFVRDEVKP
jgi:hypothetical protein